MVTHLPKLHHQIHQILHLHFRLAHFKELLYVEFLFEGVVEVLLSAGHLADDLVFDLATDLVLDVFFYTAEHEGLEDGVEALDLVLVEGALVLAVGLDVFGEPLLELLVGVEELGHYEVEQGPELGHCVLDGGAS